MKKLIYLAPFLSIGTLNGISNLEPKFDVKSYNDGFADRELTKKKIALSYIQKELEVEEIEPANTNDASVTEPYDQLFGAIATPFWDNIALVYPLKATNLMNLYLNTIDLVDNYYGDDKYKESDKDPDAYRHIHLLAQITYEYGEDFANEFLNSYPGYTGSDIKNSNRYTMDHNNDLKGIYVGKEYRDRYHAHMTGTVSNNLGAYVSHVVKYGSYYSIYKLNSTCLSFVNTTEGVRCSLFPPYC